MDLVRQHIASGRRYLVIELITGAAKVTDGKGVFRRRGGPGWMQIASVDLAFILERFEQEAPPRDVFTLSEVAPMTQQKSATLHSWVKAGVLTPSLRDRDGTRGRAMLFSRFDAFVACLVASLKRKCGLPLSKLKAVSDALKGDEPPQPPSRSAGVSEGNPSRRAEVPEESTRWPAHRMVENNN